MLKYFPSFCPSKNTPGILAFRILKYMLGSIMLSNPCKTRPAMFRPTPCRPSRPRRGPKSFIVVSDPVVAKWILRRPRRSGPPIDHRPTGPLNADRARGAGSRRGRLCAMHDNPRGQTAGAEEDVPSTLSRTGRQPTSPDARGGGRAVQHRTHGHSDRYEELRRPLPGARPTTSTSTRGFWRRSWRTSWGRASSPPTPRPGPRGWTPLLPSRFAGTPSGTRHFDGPRNIFPRT